MDTVIGFINRLREFPAAMGAVIKIEQQFFVQWANYKRQLLIDVTDERTLLEHSNYYCLTPPQQIDSASALFAFAVDDIFIGSREALLAEINRRLETSACSDEAREILNEYVVDLMQRTQGSPDARQK